MQEATAWVREQKNKDIHHMILTDSMSLVEALRADDWKDNHEWLCQIKKNIDECEGKLTILWIPSHVGTPGNEMADHLASQGSQLEQAVPIPFGILKAKVKSKKWKISHSRAKQMYGDRRGPKTKVEKKWSRRQRTLFARLRTNHAKELKHYQHRIGNVEDAICDICGEGEETITHVLCSCPALEAKRQQIHSGVWTLDMMVDSPEKCRQLLQHRFPALKEKEANNETKEDTLERGTSDVSSQETAREHQC